MVSVGAPAAGLSASLGRLERWRRALFWVGLAAIAVPTFVAIAQQNWSTEQGQHGPIVLAIGVWLVVRRWRAMWATARPGSIALAAPVGVLAAATYVLARIADQYLVESYALYVLGLTIFYALVGAQSMRRSWFPLAYLIFALPMPYTLTWTLTSHLRLWITQAAVALLHDCGLSVVRDGLNIFIDQYEIAVKEACSGMNSLISLSAIGFFYIYIRRGQDWRYLALMALPIFGFAIVANFVRVLIVVLMTHFFGDAVAQGFLHETAGMITFITALIGVMAFDHVAAPLLLRRTRLQTGSAQ